MNIIIGKHDKADVRLDVDKLLSSRLLVQANSGKGKSHLLRRIAEQLFGKVQVIILDPEGEFATLREKFGYVLVGKGGETPADPRSAGLVAHTLLELRASAVCDLYEMKPAARHEFVAKFLDAMIDAPKNLWHPCVVIVDEAHVFCPEKGAGESEASEAMIGLATRGRKRGFACIFATQRLGKLRKDAAAELLNVMIGGTFIDVDRKRAADALGVYGADLHKFFDEIKVMERGYFYSLGPAVSLDRVLCHVLGVETSHPEAGSAKHAAEPPPPPEAISKLLPNLSDLPKAAEEKTRTEAELRKEIRELRAQVRSAPAGKPVKIKVTDPRELKRVVREVEDEFGRKFSYVAHLNFKTWQDGRRLLKALDEAAKAAARMFPDEAPKYEMPKRKEIPAGEIQHKGEPLQKKPVVQQPRPDVSSNGDSDLAPYQLDILRGLADLEALGRGDVPNALAAVAAGKSGTSSTWERYRGKLQAQGLISYPSPGRIAITDNGRDLAPQSAEPLDNEELHAKCLKLLTPYQQDLLKALIIEYPALLTREELGEKSGKQSTSSTFERYVGQLKGMEIVTYPTPKTVKASDWLFLD